MLAVLGPDDGYAPGNILAGLCDTDNSGEYHWLIYLVKDAQSGYKFHAHNRMNTESWRYECAEWNGATSQKCVAFTKIGRLRTGMDWKDMDAVLKDIPMAVPDRDRPLFRSNFTCLVWFREALRTLHNAKIIRLTIDHDAGLSALEDDLRGKAYAMQLVRQAGLQPLVPVIMRPTNSTRPVQNERT